MMQFGDYCGTTVIHNAGPLRMGEIFTDLNITRTHLGCLDGRSEFQSVHCHQNTVTPQWPFRGWHSKHVTASQSPSNLVWEECLQLIMQYWGCCVKLWYMFQVEWIKGNYRIGTVLSNSEIEVSGIVTPLFTQAVKFGTFLIFCTYVYFELRTAVFKTYCAISVRRSNFRHQASPRVSPRDSTQRRKVELWARNVR